MEPASQWWRPEASGRSGGGTLAPESVSSVDEMGALSFKHTATGSSAWQSAAWQTGTKSAFAPSAGGGTNASTPMAAATASLLAASRSYSLAPSPATPQQLGLGKAADADGVREPYGDGGLQAYMSMAEQLASMHGRMRDEVDALRRGAAKDREVAAKEREARAAAEAAAADARAAEVAARESEAVARDTGAKLQTELDAVRKQVVVLTAAVEQRANTLETLERRFEDLRNQAEDERSRLLAIIGELERAGAAAQREADMQRARADAAESEGLGHKAARDRMREEVSRILHGV